MLQKIKHKWKSLSIINQSIIVYCISFLFIAGGVSLICPVPFESKFIVDMFVAIGSGCLLWLLTIHRHELNRIGGILMLFVYVMYFIYLC